MSFTTLTSGAIAVLLFCSVDLPVPGAGERGDQPANHEAIIRSVYDLAKLTPAQARRLHGRRATFRIALDTDAYREGQHDIYGCISDETIERSLFVPAGVEIDNQATVEALLCVIEHTPAVIGNTFFMGFTEYRLLSQ
jgi:hypothetical protein